MWNLARIGDPRDKSVGYFAPSVDEPHFARRASWNQTGVTVSVVGFIGVRYWCVCVSWFSRYEPVKCAFGAKLVQSRNECFVTTRRHMDWNTDFTLVCGRLHRWVDSLVHRQNPAEGNLANQQAQFMRQTEHRTVSTHGIPQQDGCTPGNSPSLGLVRF